MSKQIQSWLMLVLLACIWGSSFFLMKRGMLTESGEPVFTATQVGALRMAIAGIVMLPFGLVSWRKINSLKVLISLLVVGFFGNFFPAFLFTFAETKLSSGLAGMLNSFTPFFTLFIGWAIFKQALIVRQVLGLLIAFVGMVLLVGLSGGKNESLSWMHIAAVLLATFMYGTSLNTIKHNLGQFKSWEITALAFSLVAIPAWTMLAITGTFSTITLNPHAVQGLGYIALLSIVGTCFALVLFNRIIALKSAVFASSVTYIIPIVAVVIGFFLLQEHFHVFQLIGMAVVITGVFIANRS